MRSLPIAPDTINSRHMIMERTEVLDLMGELKLFGMKNAYDEILATAIKRQHEPQRFAGELLKAEICEKQARSIKYQLTIAVQLPLAKDIDGFEFKNTINEHGARSHRRRLHRTTAQRRSGRRDGHRQDASGDGDRAQLHPRRIARPGQRRRSGQPARSPARTWSPRTSPVLSSLTSSFSMSSAICRSPRPADSFCSIWSAVSTSGPR